MTKSEHFYRDWLFVGYLLAIYSKVNTDFSDYVLLPFTGRPANDWKLLMVSDFNGAFSVKSLVET